MVSLLCVHSLVDAEAGALTESLPTLITLVRPLPSVDSHVSLQGGEGAEGIPTLSAVKGLLCEMSSCVTPEG